MSYFLTLLLAIFLVIYGISMQNGMLSILKDIESIKLSYSQSGILLDEQVKKQLEE